MRARPLRQTAPLIGLLLGLPAILIAANIGKGQTPLNTGALVCDGQPHHQTWTAPAKVAIRHLDIWIGADRDAVADIYSTVFARAHDLPIGYVLLFFGWDRYANPTAPHQYARDWPTADAITLEAGEQLVLEHRCEAFSPGAVHSHSQVIIDWEQVP